MAGAANSFTARRLSPLPPLSHKKQTHWYKILDDKDLVSAGRISPEFADFMGRYPDDVAFSASELVFFDSLASIIL